MVKLTPELIAQTAQFTNPIRDRELDLRGFKIPAIENLGATLDQFDTIDFSDNDIRKLDGFPLLRRLKCLLLNNNRITRVGDHLETNLPNLETIILTNNNIQELGDLDCLASIKQLTTLSLLRNPVTRQKHYRLYVTYKLPQLRLLDFQKIKDRDRQAASRLFKGQKGASLAKELGKRPKTFVPGAGLPGAAAGVPDKADAGSEDMAAAAITAAAGAPPKQDIEAIKAAIAAASTLEEVERLNRMLQSGLIPGRENLQPAAATSTDSSGQNGVSKHANDEEEDMST